MLRRALFFLPIFSLGAAALFLTAHQSLPGFADFYPESGISIVMGAYGASWADYDNDGLVDLLVAGRPLQLFRNLGGGKFLETTASAGLAGVGSTVYAGVFGDYDNDGCRDLYVVTIRQDRLYRNLCDGTFRDVTYDAGIRRGDGLDLGRGAAWGDYDRDGFLDLYVAEYENVPNVLYRNQGDGTFADVTEAAGVGGLSSCPQSLRHRVGKYSFQPVWFDYNGDSWPDLYVSNDAGISTLYRNQGDGVFEDVTSPAGLCKFADGMGVAVGDYDGDGWQDIYLTNTGANLLWRNQGDGTFIDLAAEAGVSDWFSLGWGTAFLDYDNDGDLDLYAVNGDVHTRSKMQLHSGDIRLDRLFRNDGGIFTDVTDAEGIQGDFPKRGAAVADYDRNGFPDLFVTGDLAFEKQSHRLYRSYPNGNRWLAVELEGRRSNREGIGAEIRLTAGGRTQMRQVVSGISLFSQDDLVQIFGLGRAKRADRLEVRWPSGAVQVLEDVPAGDRIRVVEE